MLVWAAATAAPKPLADFQVEAQTRFRFANLRAHVHAPLGNLTLLREYDRQRVSHERRERAKSALGRRANATLVQAVEGSGADAPVQLVIDTDLGFDVDDVGALAVANHLQDVGRCRLLAVVHNTGFYKGIGGVDAINHYYGRTDLELGAYKGAWGSSSDAQDAQDRYTSTVEGRYPSPVKNFDQVSSAVDAYRKVLNAAADNSVVIASIGELTNLRDILMAEKDLFNRKVKQIHYMNGGYNFGCGDSQGSGWSPWLGSTQDCDGAAQYVQEHVAHNVMQAYSLNGGDVQCGSRFQDGCGQGPVKDAYQIWTNYGSRSSWDLITTYFAVMGVNSLYSSANAGVDHVDFHGNENFDTSVGTQYNEYQVWIDGSHNGDVTRVLDDIMCSAPCGGPGVGACASYTMYSGHNCYTGHGATDIDGATSCGVMSIHECQARCDGTADCNGIVVANAGDGKVNCYRKKNVVIGGCDYGNAWAFDTWVKN